MTGRRCGVSWDGDSDLDTTLTMLKKAIEI